MAKFKIEFSEEEFQLIRATLHEKEILFTKMVLECTLTNRPVPQPIQEFYDRAVELGARLAEIYESRKS